PFACRLNKGRYHFGQKTLTIEKFFLGENAIHGLIYDAPFDVVEQGTNDEAAWVAMRFSYIAADPGYPFNYDCTVTYKLQQDNKLTLTTEVIDQDKGLIPMQDGWHPYFKFDTPIDELQLEFQSKELVVFDEALIPTGQLERYEEFGSLKKIGSLELDNCFTVNFAECQPLCVLRDAGKKLQLEIYPTHSYPYLQVYTPPHRNSIALENLSAAPDTFNNSIGLEVLQPGETRSYTTTYKITSLS
ncbi:MAG: aldose 1-epimerase, partial [Ferruginibacter sp.]|nr:aldose 1-epimerase [Ferruginibacter sp.]